MIPLLALVLSIWWPFTSSKPPECGDLAACFKMTGPVASFGSVREISSVWRNGKKQSKRVILRQEKNPGRLDFTIQFNPEKFKKLDGAPEWVVLKYK